jgi:hypothetical protein
MKGFKKWSPLCLPVALIVGLVAGWMVVQQVGVTPSEAQGITEYGAILAAKLPPKLKASPTPPPEEEMGPPPEQTPRQRPTRESLLEKIRQMPGGKELLEEARKRGARIGMAKPVEPEPSLSWLNPLRVKVAEAQSSFSMTLTPDSPFSSSPYGSLYALGSRVGGTLPNTSVLLYKINYSATVGTSISQPSVSFTFDAPADGWYIVNIEAGGAQASLKHYEGGTWTTVQSWSYSGSSGTLSYPALLELTTGRHNFYWVSSSTVYVYEADAYSL